MSDTTEFADGFYAKAPHEKAPDFVKCTISIKRKDFGNWLRGKDDEWINLQVKESRDGKYYAQVDNWKPKEGAANSFQEKASSGPDDGFGDIPFIDPYKFNSLVV